MSERARSNTKTTKTPITDELIKEVCSLYGDRYDDRDEDTSLGGRDWHPGELASHKSLLVFKRELEDEGIFLSTGKIRKILITGGLYSSERSREIAEEYEDCGGNVEEVADNLGLSIPTVNIYLPYKRTAYKLENKTSNAKRIDRWRLRKELQAGEGIDANDSMDTKQR